MSFIKLGSKIIDLAQVDIIDLSYDLLDDENIVKLYFREHAEHIYLDKDLSEKLRWFLAVSSANLGILDVEKAYEQRDVINAQIKALQAAHEADVAKRQATTETLPTTESSRGKLLQMPSRPYPSTLARLSDEEGPSA